MIAFTAGVYGDEAWSDGTDHHHATASSKRMHAASPQTKLQAVPLGCAAAAHEAASAVASPSSRSASSVACSAQFHHTTAFLSPLFRSLVNSAQ